MSKSTPSLTEFDPTIIPYQIEVIKDVRQNFDYNKGAHEVLLSGSVGSAKSILMAHIGVTHCLLYPGAILGIGRKAFPDLRDTIFQDILDHIEGSLTEGKDYEVNHTRCSVQFRNGSKIVSRSWSDKKYKKWRSLKLSAAIVEELTENNDEDKTAYDELKLRVGRVPHVKENFIVCATNPDEPEHWAYKYFIKSKKQTRHTYYSITTDNPFLPKQYINQLLEDLDPLMAQRMVYGKWVRIAGDTIYHQYDKRHNFIDSLFSPDPLHEIHISFDFNIGEGKPMSAVLFQYIKGRFHFFDESIVHGARTEDILEDLVSRDLIIPKYKYVINGDATGKARSTSTRYSDYDIIRKYLDNCEPRIQWRSRVPSANPPVRTRHNKVNGQLCNAKGLRRLLIYKPCKTLDEGMSLTKLKKGGNYIEDDSKAYQHCTTALGYGVCSTLVEEGLKQPVRFFER